MPDGYRFVAVAAAWAVAAASSGAAVGAPLQHAASAGAPPKLQSDQLVAATRTMLEVEASAGRFSGAVLIARDGQPILVEAYGLADGAAGVRNSAETQFRIGSVGKLFTTVAILQLAQAGKLDLQAPVGRYLIDYPDPTIAGQATVAHLLSHTGGTGDVFGPEFVAHRDELRDPEDYIAFFGARPPVSVPGTERAYSNYGFMILGRIVEVVSGLPFDRYVEANIFSPAGMTASGFVPEDVPLKTRAVAYTELQGRLTPVTQESLAHYRAIHGRGYMEFRGGPAGGSYSTVRDLMKFGIALTGGMLISAETLGILTTGRVTLRDGGEAGYDYGGRLPDGRRFIGHVGGAPGQCANLRIYPSNGYTIVVLANRDPPGCFQLTDFIGDRTP